MFSAIFSDYHLFDRLYGVDRRQRKWIRCRGDAARAPDAFRGGTVRQPGSVHGAAKPALIGELARNRPIDVFDEWAADQDPAFRERFYTRIVPELKHTGHTVLLPPMTAISAWRIGCSRWITVNSALTTQSPVDGNADHH